MGKTIIITGASEGIGKSIALALAKQSNNLILIARNKENLENTKAQAIKQGAGKVDIYAIDLTNEQQVDEFTNNLKEQGAIVDGLINNAGIWQKKAPLDEIPDDEIKNVLSTNLTGMILLTKKVLPLIRKSSSGFIINISSRSGYSAQQGQSVYSASKYGVRGFTEVLREDLIESGIRVAGIYQGGTNTQMFNKAGESFSDEKLATFIPSQELANVISFLVNLPKGIWLPEIRVENK